MVSGIEREAYRALARSLKDARQAAGLSQRDLADMTGIKQGKISSVEQALGNPTLKTLAKMAHACGVSLSITKDNLES